MKTKYGNFARGMLSQCLSTTEMIHHQKCERRWIDGPIILQSELENALRAIKNGKTSGHGEIYCILKCWELTPPPKKKRTDLLNKIYKTVQILKHWMNSTFVVLLRKIRPGYLKIIEWFKTRVLNKFLYSKCEKLMVARSSVLRRHLRTRQVLYFIEILQKALTTEKICFYVSSTTKRHSQKYKNIKMWKYIRDESLSEIRATLNVELIKLEYSKHATNLKHTLICIRNRRR